MNLNYPHIKDNDKGVVKQIEESNVQAEAIFVERICQTTYIEETIL